MEHDGYGQGPKDPKGMQWVQSPIHAALGHPKVLLS